MGFHDFAGSAAIHYVGGLTALIGAWMLGPRIGKYAKDGTPHGIPGHNIPLGALGVFILWFGWYGFNGAAAKNGTQLATIFATTTVAPALATCTVMIVTWVKYGKPDVAMSLNGSLAGLVAITAGCDAVNVLGACIIGILSGFNVIFFTWFLDYKLHVDDPVGAVPVHYANGALGTICVGLFACGTDTMPKAQGLFYGGGFKLLGIQILGLIVIGIWTAITMYITFAIIRATVGLRVTTEEEITGLDPLEHGMESAYAGFSFKSELVDGATYEEDHSGNVPVSIDQAIPTKVEGSIGEISNVVIITKPERFARLKDALNEIGVAGMTSSQVMGCGIQKGQTNYYRGAKVEMQLLSKLKVEVVVSEIPVEKVVNTAKKALYTGHMGDGKIFVYNVEDVVRISSGDQGKDALAYNE
jgi:Amt family ammonium transporter